MARIETSPRRERLPIDKQIRQHRALREQAEFLIDDADAMLPRDDWRTYDDRDAVEFDLAGVRANNACEHFHQRRFARAVFPDDGMNLTAAHGEVHAVNGGNAPIALA